MWQALSDVKKAEAAQELRDGYSLEEKAGEIVILRDLIAKLPRAFLLTLSLGNEKEVTNALKPNASRKYYATLERYYATEQYPQFDARERCAARPA